MFVIPTVELYFGKESGTKEMFDLIKRSKFSVLVLFFFTTAEVSKHRSLENLFND